MKRRNMITVLSAGVAAAALGVTVAARRTARGRAAESMLGDFVHARLWWRARRLHAESHPMQYLVAAPDRGRPQAAIITLDGADHDFLWNSATFVRARCGRPFVVVTPYIVSNGGRVDPTAYPYTATELSAAMVAPLAFDVTGVAAVVASLRAQYDLATIYLAAYSAGGHLGWKLALDAPELWSGVALACSNFAGRGLATSAAVTRSHVGQSNALPIRGFQGALDSRRPVLQPQWNAGVELATSRGFTQVSYQVVEDAGHSPCAAAVFAWCDVLDRVGRASHRK